MKSNLHKFNCLTLIEKLNSDYGLSLRVVSFKPLIGNSDKCLFNDKKYLFYSKTWKGLLTQLQAFGIALNLTQTKQSMFDVYFQVSSSMDKMQTEYQKGRVVCKNRI